MDERKLAKLKKKLPESVIEEIDGQDETSLKSTIVAATAAIEKAVKERNENPRYQAAREQIKDLMDSTRDLTNYQKAKIAYSFYRLNGGDDSK